MTNRCLEVANFLGQDADLHHRNQELIMGIPRVPFKAPVN